MLVTRRTRVGGGDGVDIDATGSESDSLFEFALNDEPPRTTDSMHSLQCFWSQCPVHVLTLSPCHSATRTLLKTPWLKGLFLLVRKL